ncbi:MAG: transporter substrate-binding domain-containing protein [Flavobacteriales bacterium]
MLKINLIHTAAIQVILALGVGPTATATTASDTSALRIGVAGTAPFILHNADKPGGLSMEIWDEVAGNLDLRYTTTNFPSVPDALDALLSGKVDAVVGPVSITSERAARMELTHPYFRSSLSILSRTDDLGLWERVKPFFTIKLLYALFVFLFILACVGTLLWLAERRASPEQFPNDPARGIGNGMWCAIVTMSTTGYGDIAPVTTTGRIIAGSWMVVSILFATSMVAGIASTLTLTGMGRTVIDSADKLPGKKVAVLADSPALGFVADNGGMPVTMENLNSCYAALKAKQVDAVVFDRPQLLYFLHAQHDRAMAVSSAQYQPQGYGFAFPTGSALMPAADVEMLRLKENGSLDKLIGSWLGDKAD